MENSENNRLSPYEFDLTAESLQGIYTYGQPIRASAPSVAIMREPVGMQPEDLAANLDRSVITQFAAISQIR